MTPEWITANAKRLNVTPAWCHEQARRLGVEPLHIIVALDRGRPVDAIEAADQWSDLLEPAWSFCEPDSEAADLDSIPDENGYDVHRARRTTKAFVPHDAPDFPWPEGFTPGSIILLR